MRQLKKIIKVETKQGYVRPKQWDWREKGVVTHAKNQCELVKLIKKC